MGKTVTEYNTKTAPKNDSTWRCMHINLKDRPSNPASVWIKNYYITDHEYIHINTAEYKQ